MDQIFSSKRDAFLQAHDPIVQRIKARMRPGNNNTHRTFLEHLGDESQDDDELTRLRLSRLQEIQRDDLAHSHAVTEGHGSYRDVTQQEALVRGRQ